MKIFVEFMAFIRRPDSVPRVFERLVDEPMNVKQFLKHLKFTSDEIRMMQCFVSTPSDNSNVRVQRNYDLKDGDHLFVTLPIGGG